MTMLVTEGIVEKCDVTTLGDADRTLLERRLRHRPAVVEAQDWIVRVGDEIVASASLHRYPQESNPHWREAWIGRGL